MWSPPKPNALVVIALPTPDGCASWRERFVANALARVGAVTLLVELARADEVRPDVAQLAERLSGATTWARREVGPELPLGYLGVGSGAAAAFVLTALQEHDVGAIVSRSSRPDFAGAALVLTHTPALFLVTGDDELEMAANRAACGRSTHRALELIPSGVEGSEDLAHAALASARWFTRWLN